MTPACCSIFKACAHRLIPAAAVWLLILSGCSQGPRVAEDKGAVAWDRYYTSAETNRILETYVARYPALTTLYSIGKSYQGADLYVLEVTNKDSGPAQDKPGFYVDGNIHSGELTGSAATLYLAGYLLDRYGKDSEVTKLLDTRVFYLRPKFNPDGADLSLLKDISLRSTVHPVDDDEDGAADEDPAQDLNGDGFITQMRIPDPQGQWKISPDDPRLMVRRPRDETGGSYYRVVSEGIDDDGDGRLNEDGVGGIDMNRNFPRNWEPEYLQPGAGPFPLSEPETYATIRFLDAHPNVTGIVHNHTSGGFVYRLPSASDPSKFNPDDLALIETLGAKYTETTGRPIQPSSTDPTRHRYGTLISWAYWDRGIIGWVPELWPGIAADTDGDGRTSELERLRFNDEELGGKYFINWSSYDHPEFGMVEIGGWKSRFINQNPPPEMLEQECVLQVPWVLYLANQSPFLTMKDPTVEDLGGGRFAVEVEVTNTGFLPTNLTQRGMEAQVVKSVVAAATVAGGKLLEGDRRADLGHLAGSYPVPGADRGSSAKVRWVVQPEAQGASLTIEVISEKGGTIRRTVAVGPQ